MILNHAELTKFKNVINKIQLLDKRIKLKAQKLINYYVIGAEKKMQLKT